LSVNKEKKIRTGPDLPKNKKRAILDQENSAGYWTWIGVCVIADARAVSRLVVQSQVGCFVPTRNLFFQTQCVDNDVMRRERSLSYKNIF
jgi:hypothetical protein